MVYKILFLESLVIAGMFYLRFKPDQSPTLAESPEITAPAAPVPGISAAVEELPVPTYQKVDPPKKGLTFPVKGYSTDAVISVFGDKRGKNRLHQGIDIKAPRGTAVVAATDGFIERVKEGGNGGKQVYLRGAQGKLFYYAHLESWSVKEYQAVKAGEVIGEVGDSGNARGTTPHLHFEILLGKKKKAIDPLQFWAVK